MFRTERELKGLEAQGCNHEGLRVSYDETGEAKIREEGKAEG